LSLDSERVSVWWVQASQKLCMLQASGLSPMGLKSLYLAEPKKTSFICLSFELPTAEPPLLPVRSILTSNLENEQRPMVSPTHNTSLKSAPGVWLSPTGYPCMMQLSQPKLPSHTRPVMMTPNMLLLSKSFLCHP
jgi:hypothetical protein